MEHPNFVEAGQEAGIEIWNIDKFEPVPVETKLYGKFYNGDAYIVLKTNGQDTLTHDAHFWLGEKTTQDKMGSAAIWTITLDDMLGGKAVHHREVQGHESSLFLGYFKPAIRYLEGGNESGFNEVETNAGAEKRLLKLSGCDNMRIKEVPAESPSLTKDHCFILEVDHDIFVLMPEGAKATQRRKIISVANKLRDDEHNGRAAIEIIDEFSSDEDVALFFEALGSGSKDEIENDDSSETYTRADIAAVFLYKVLVGDDIDLVPLNKPFKQSKMTSEDIFILDTPCSGVYIWIGSDVSSDVKKTYNDIADKYLESKEYPKWVNVTKVSQGSESSTFKQYFHNWESVGMFTKTLTESDAGYYSEDAEQSAATAKLIGKSAAARGYMPDQGDGNLTVTRILNEEQQDVTEEFEAGVSVLYQSEVYLMKYKYENEAGEEAYVLYCWTGADANATDVETVIAKAFEEEDELGLVTIVKVPQGKEPKHFLSIFKGNLAVLFGSSANKRTNAKQSYEDDGTRVFRVEGTELGVDMRAIQVEEVASSLEDDDVYILETPNTIYLWNGKESNETEQAAAEKFVQMVVGEDRDITVIDQGEEPQEFWEALGGQPEEKEDPSGWRLAVNRRVTTPRTLSAVTVTVTGKIRFEDLDTKYSQEDLSDDGIYILDTGEELYLWQGANMPERFKNARINIIQEYIEDDGLERTVDTALVVFVKQGAEPLVFKNMFPEWDLEMWENMESYEDIKNETKAANSK